MVVAFPVRLIVPIGDLTVSSAHRGWSDVTPGCCEASGDRSLHHTVKTLTSQNKCNFLSRSFLTQSPTKIGEPLRYSTGRAIRIIYQFVGLGKLEMTADQNCSKAAGSLYEGLFCSVGQGLLLNCNNTALFWKVYVSKLVNWIIYDAWGHVD